MNLTILFQNPIFTNELRLFNSFVQIILNSGKMVLISFTNIVVDDFSYGKKRPSTRFIYFLTHMHSGTHSPYHFRPLSRNFG